MWGLEWLQPAPEWVAAIHCNAIQDINANTETKPNANVNTNIDINKIHIQIQVQSGYSLLLNGTCEGQCNSIQGTSEENVQRILQECKITQHHNWVKEKGSGGPLEFFFQRHNPMVIFNFPPSPQPPWPAYTGRWFDWQATLAELISIIWQTPGRSMRTYILDAQPSTSL